MKRLFLSLVLLCFIGVQPVAAQQSPSPQDAQYERWGAYYYFHKDTDRMTDYLQWLQNSQILEKNEKAAAPLAAFLSVVFADNPQHVQDWVKSTQFTGKTKEWVEFALWQSGHGKLIAEIFKDAPDFAKSDPIPLKNFPLKNPAHLSMMWSAFLASGDIVYVKKIIDTLDDDQSLTGEEALDKVTRDWPNDC